MDNGNDDSSGSIREDNIYKSNKEKLVLVLLSDLYLELEIISVSTSKSSSYPIAHYLLTALSY